MILKNMQMNIGPYNLEHSKTFYVTEVFCWSISPAQEILAGNDLTVQERMK